MAQIDIYTDGAARGNPGPGGYGIVMLSGQHRKELAAGYKLTTNNRMELLAVIVALETIKPAKHDIRIFSDSRYVTDAINKGWIYGWIKKNWREVKNPDLWQRLLPLLKAYQPKFIWVKGHSDNPLNNRCDELATAAADGKSLLRDTVYEASRS
jgi:ribonuclease HI